MASYFFVHIYGQEEIFSSLGYDYVKNSGVEIQKRGTSVDISTDIPAIKGAVVWLTPYINKEGAQMDTLLVYVIDSCES